MAELHGATVYHLYIGNGNRGAKAPNFYCTMLARKIKIL